MSENENKDTNAGATGAPATPASSAHQAADAPQGKDDKFLPASILIAAVLIAGALVFTSIYNGSGHSAGDAGTAGTTPPTNPAAPAVATSSIMALGARDAILGNANAPVTLIEYGDYQCPYCGQFFLQTEPTIISNYVNAGKVRMVFRNYAFLGPESLAAAAAAECAEDQNKLWPYHDALYNAKMADDAKGGSENDGFFTRAELITLAQGAGLNVAAFTTCIDSGKYATQVSDERTAASADGIGSTPTFFVNGAEIVGAQPYAAFESAINTALQG